ncbi:MAG TPA: hypothetical protein VGL40_12445 [Bacillota bacterium]
MAPSAVSAPSAASAPPAPAAIGRGLPTGSRVIVVGGGIAGSGFARQLARLSKEAGRPVHVTLLSSTACNYCGGLLTRVSRGTLEGLLDYPIHDELILGQVDEAVYVTPAGEVPVPIGFPIFSILRTDKFGYPGFDDTFREELVSARAHGPAGATGCSACPLVPPGDSPSTCPAACPSHGCTGCPIADPTAATTVSADPLSQIELIEPAVITKVERPSETTGEEAPSTAGPTRPWRVFYHSYEQSLGFIPHHVDGDVLVLATGLRSLNSKLLKEFSREYGYVPPPLMDASVTEIDSTAATYDRLEGRMLILDNVIPGLLAAIIPKRPGWLTMTSLGRVLTREDIDHIFAHPSVRRYLELPEPTEHLRCHAICPAMVYTGPAADFYGDGWLCIGDLTGHGRVLKDGYFGALYGAHLAAVTLVERGAGRDVLARYFDRPLRPFVADNRVGMFLFHLDQRLMRTGWFPRLLTTAAEKEGPPETYGGPVRAAIRGLATGEISYRWMLAFFAAGLIRFLVIWPFRALARLFAGRGAARGISRGADRGLGRGRSPTPPSA